MRMFLRKQKITYSKSLIWLFVSVLLCLGFCGCSKQQQDLLGGLDPVLVWPKSPDKARVEYLGSIATEDDLKRGVSFGQGLSDFIWGRKDIGAMAGPASVAVDGDNLYVADYHGSVIHIFNLNTREYKQFYKIDDQVRLLRPVSLVIARGQLIIADSQLQKVCIFDLEGNFQKYFTTEPMERPAGLAFGSVGEKLYVSDAAMHKVGVFDLQGNKLMDIGKRGVGPGEFNYPTHLHVDNLGNLFVSDTLNYRIQAFKPNGKLGFTFGKHGDRPGNFAHPCAISSDSHGNIYISDKQFENIQIFNSKGQILMAFGQEGKLPGEFWLPSGLFIDGQNRIFVADTFNKRVQVFKLLEDSE